VVERETRRGEEVERERYNPPDPPNPRLVNSVLEFAVATDWMAALLSAPGVASCSPWLPAVDSINLFLQSCHR
jgi:hypothetical protein